MTMAAELVLPNVLADRADDDAVFLQHVDGASVTYREAEDAIQTWTGVLADVGVEAGETVVVMLPNSFESLFVWMAAARLQAIETPLNTAYVGNMLQHAVTLSAATVAVVHERFLSRFEELGDRLPDLATVIVVGSATAPSAHFTVVAAEEALRAQTASHGRVPGRRVAGHETACIMFTSGTTGPSKGVVVPWAQLHAMTEGIMPSVDLDQSDAWYSPFPTFHASGKVPMYSAALVHSRVVMREAFSTSKFWGDILAFGCTTTLLIGTMSSWLASQPPSPDDARAPLHNVLFAPMPEDAQAFMARFGLRGRIVFNMTEVSSPIASRWELVPEGSCGQLRKGYDVRIVDEFDQEVPVGEVGEIIVRADEPWRLNQGYWRMPEKTAEAWRNGWFHTGDAGRRDENGYFYFLDRKKDAMRVRGENVSSMEVESEVSAFPGVREVAAIGVPSEHGEEDVAVFVVPVDAAAFDPQALIDFLTPRVPRFMLPRYVCPLDVLPKTPTEKVRKDELRKNWPEFRSWQRPSDRRAADH